MSQKVKVAAVQAAPVLFDLDASIAKAIGLAEQAKGQQCALVAFGEAWLPGYPFHIWLGPPAWTLQFATRYHEQSLEIDSPEWRRLCEAARDIGIAIAIGYSERDGTSLYLGQALIGADGVPVFTRRKLKPTHVERTVFGEGYGPDLAVRATPFGRVGALCCWEHLQPLSKYAMYSQGEQVHIAGWPAFALYREQAFALGREVNMAASQVYAVEGGCFVVAASSIVDQATLDVLGVGRDAPPLICLGGGAAMIFGPDGRPLAEHIPETEEGLIVAELDLGLITLAKAIADPAGHYAKPEVTQLLFAREARRPVVDMLVDPPVPVAVS